MSDGRPDPESSEEKTATASAKRRVSRRGLIAKGAAVAAGGIGLAAVAATPAEASTGTMIYGTDMDAGSDGTGLTSTYLNQTLRVRNLGTGGGIFAESLYSTAIIAQGFGGNGVFAAGGIGVYARGDRAPLLLLPSEAPGAPTSDVHQPGEVFVDGLGRQFLCVSLGVPGTWVRPGLNPIDAFRVCDTRSGTGTPYSNGTKLGPGANLLVNVAGEAAVPVPEGTTAIVANLSVTEGTATSYLTAYRADLASPPNASSIHFERRTTISNQITVPLDDNGDVRIFNAAGSVHLFIDIAGFFF